MATEPKILHAGRPDPSIRDVVGYETLRRMATVARYNEWIYDEVEPYCGASVLEVGCGIGNMTDYFVDRELLVGIDLLPAAIEQLRLRHTGCSHIHAHQGDILDEAFAIRLGDCYAFNTVLCLNVLEHIDDDSRALQHMRQLLLPGGYLLLFVPAGAYMYGSLDHALGHYRRYEQRKLAALVGAAGFEIERLDYLNLAGIPGWWLNSKVLRRRLLPTNQLTWFNRLAPLFIRSEKRLRRVWDVPFGQSLLCIARRVGS